MQRLAGALVSLFAAVGWNEAAGDAWWVAALFKPEHRAVEGLPVSSVDATWVAASALREEMLPPQSREPGESVQDHHGHLMLSSDLDGDQRPEKALVGVYRDKAGRTGRFLLILGSDQRGAMQKQALFTEPGPAGFSVLFHKANKLVWAFCMECDSGCTVVPVKGGWELDCRSCCDEAAEQVELTRSAPTCNRGPRS
jgi:hypothetical protein